MAEAEAEAIPQISNTIPKIRLSVRNQLGKTIFMNQDTVIVNIHFPQIVKIGDLHIKLVAQIVVENSYEDIVIAEHSFPGTTISKLEHSFSKVPFSHETFHGEGTEAGDLASLRFLVQVKIDRDGGGSFFKEREILVRKYVKEPELGYYHYQVSIEAAIPRCYHVKMHFPKRFYHLYESMDGSLEYKFDEAFPNVTTVGLKAVRVQLFHRTYVYKDDRAHAVSLKIDASTVIEFGYLRLGNWYKQSFNFRLSGLVPSLVKAYGKRFSFKYFVRLVCMTALDDPEDEPLLNWSDVMPSNEREVFIYRAIGY